MKLTKNFLEEDYANRQLVVIDSPNPIEKKLCKTEQIGKRKKISTKSLNIIYKDKKSELTFYPEKYVLKKLYIAHPKLDNYYIQNDLYIEYILQEKLSELQSILYDLGATELTVECIQNEKKKTLFGLNIDKLFSNTEEDNNISNNTKSDVTFSNSSVSEGKIAVHAVYEDPQPPKYPEKLIWYKEDLVIKNLIDHRLTSRMKEFSFKLDMVNDIEMDVKAIFDISKIAGKEKISFNSGFKGEYKQQMDTSWVIKGTF